MGGFLIAGFDASEAHGGPMGGRPIRRSFSDRGCAIANASGGQKPVTAQSIKATPERVKSVRGVAVEDLPATTILRRLWRDWCRPYMRLILLNFLFILIFAGVNGLYAPLIKMIVDSVGKDTSAVVWILALALAVAFVKGGSLLAHRRLNVRIFSGISVDLQTALFRKMIEADSAWHAREASASLSQRIMSDVGAMENALERVVNNMIRDSLMVVALVASMIYIDWQLALIALVIFPIAIWPIVKISTILRKVGKQTQAMIGQVNARLVESLSNLQIAKTYQLEERLMRRTSSDLDDLRTLKIKAADHTAIIDPMMEVLGGIVVVAVVAFVGWKINAGHNTIGDFAGFIAALLIAGQPIRALSNLTAHVQRGLAAAQRVFQVLDEPPRIVEEPGKPALQISRGELTFKDVSFRYPDGTRALDSVSFSVGAGRRLALVGRSGAGKTTVFNLIPRLFDPTSGQVLIDGQDIRQVSLASLRDRIALVTQEAILFDDTVEANIAMGRSKGGEAGSFDPEKVRWAAKAAAADDFIAALPDGYETLIGQRGGRLSGGQRQRLSIARAFYRDAPIVLLDEATSALDAEAEQQIRSALDRLAEGRTTLIIAHRLSTITSADEIIVMDMGRIIERGAHIDLLARDGLYASLFNMQFQS